MFMKWRTADFSRKGAVPKRGKRTALIVLGAILAATMSGCSLLPSESEEEVLPPITPPTISKKPEYEVRTETLEKKVSGSGKMMSQREEKVYFTLDGMHIKELNVKTGDKVKKGQVLAVLDVTSVEKEIRGKRLQIRKSEVQMKETLRKKDEMDPVEFEEATIAFEELRQELADLEEKLGQSTLTAPFGGTVIAVQVEKGASVKAYDPIATIADTSNLVVAATFAKEDLEKFTSGMKAEVDINGAGKVAGKIKAMPTAEASSNNNGNGSGQGQGGSPPAKETLDQYVLVTLAKMPKNVERGTPLTVSIVTQRTENAIVIPVSALRSIGSRTYVQVIENDGSKREVDVEVGQQTSTDVEILKGLTVGQKVVGR
ncbi:efflux RND transporter periplasmic adaptor subunit [Paenibacillus polysaccharolyticus]|uniref:Membrane fusion protein, macrolide-specific efflux system n=1 Tax=Paenibacillus polysaccharolyticus TaxID=582692 RepID=A0A1G5KRC8_9BACL|nr:efflux RND transporter periplasmic adaptor subunit [Paenibacillus polysaccharolyticus]MCP1132729.1 efflux RND transporter periplasmic adaptor subunit [Paenibacillus polysaccharolyticus]SCZ02731.1 membrane fusion protein, macrolide-specific efflux system [Paenibacillus polysaccharolyticus]